MSAAMNKLIAAVGTNETNQHPLAGYAGILPCADTLELFVFWKGQPPAAVIAAMARLELKVTVVSNAPHTSTELRRTFDRVLADTLYWEQHGIHVAGGSLRVDGLWCEVGLEGQCSVASAGRRCPRVPRDQMRTRPRRRAAATAPTTVLLTTRAPAGGITTFGIILL
jgi:hypothetical protein